MDITFVTNTNSDQEALDLFRELGFPFKSADDIAKQKMEEELKKAEEKHQDSEVVEQETIDEKKDHMDIEEVTDNNDSSVESDNVES